MATDPRYQIDLWALRHAALSQAFASVGEELAKVEQAMTVFAAARNAVTLFDDVHPVLAHLRERVLLGAVTNGTADLRRDRPRRIISKPHCPPPASGAPSRAQPFFIWLATPSAWRRQQALYVGDDPRLDVQGAQRAGLQAMWLNRFERALPPHVAPDGVCTDLLPACSNGWRRASP